jgi:hypothetical protein
MQKSAQALSAIFVALALINPSVLPESTKYRSCSALLAKYPKGVARDAKAASRAVSEGMKRPKVNKSVYVANSGRLDRDGDGVACEQTR